VLTNETREIKEQLQVAMKQRSEHILALTRIHSIKFMWYDRKKTQYGDTNGCGIVMASYSSANGRNGDTIGRKFN
jgi:hypothetical protein